MGGDVRYQIEANLIHVTLAERWEAIYVSHHLRVEDEQEVRTASGRSPREILPESFDVSTQVYAIRYATPSQVDEFPLAIFGVGDDPHHPGLGVAWLLATREVQRAVAAILKMMPRYLNIMSQDYPLGLHNLVDARNHSHLKWCKAVGMTLEDTYTVNGFPFRRIYRPRPEELFNV